MIVLKKKNLSALIKLAIVFAAFSLISFPFTVSAQATADNYTYWVIVVTSMDGQGVDAQAIGTVLNWGGICYIVCDDLTGGTIYAFSCDGDTWCPMEECDSPAGVKDGLNWFTPSAYLECTPVPVTQGSLGEAYSVYYFNDDGLASGNITIDECEECGNVYQATIATSNIGEGMYPMLIEDGSGGLIGYVPSEGTALLFEKPSGDSGGNFSGDGNGGSASGGSNGESSSSGSGSSSYGNSRMTVIIAAAVILALVGNSYFKKQKSDKSSSASKPAQASEPAPIPAPEPLPPPIPAPVPTPIPRPVNDQNKGWFIQMDGGVMNGFIYPVHTGILIGRNPECDVRYPVDTKGVSRKHCKIFVTNNNLFVMDLGSTSGTFLRGVGQLTPNVPQNIRSGDIIYLGEKKNGIVVRYNQ